jgi:hypothetical protein
VKEAILNLSRNQPNTLMDKAYASPKQLLDDIVSFNGSVFIMFDDIDIGQAFEMQGLDDFDKGTCF